MGGVCTKDKTKVIEIKRNAQHPVTPTETPMQLVSTIGEEFQSLLERTDPNSNHRTNDWNKLIREVETFKTEEFYIKLRSKQMQSNYEIIEFNRYDMDIELDQSGKPSSQKRMSYTNTTNRIQLEHTEFKSKDEQLLNLYLLKELKPQKFTQSLLNGVVAKYRWKVWLASVYNNALYDSNLYDTLKTMSDKYNEEQIAKDVYRTFRNHSYFSQENQGQQSLYSVCKAIAINYPKTGYVQGLNQVVAFTLIANGGNEEESFQFIHFLAQNPKFMMLDIYKTQFQLLKLLLEIFNDNFRNQLPTLYEHFQEECMTDYMYVWQWGLTFFLYTFPMQVVFQLWDFILGTNILSIVSLSIAILQNYGSYLLNCNMEGISNFFRNIIKVPNILHKSASIYHFNMESVIQSALEYNKTLLVYHKLQDCVYSEIIRNDFQQISRFQELVEENKCQQVVEAPKSNFEVENID